MRIRSWRVFHKDYVDDPVSGKGASQVGGRWNSRGTPVVYSSATFALAQLEHGLDPDDDSLLKMYMQAIFEFDEKLVKHLDPADLPADWNTTKLSSSTRTIGDAWYQDQDSAVLCVPSAVDPDQCNYVINPHHPDFAKISVSEPKPLIADR